MEQLHWDHAPQHAEDYLFTPDQMIQAFKYDDDLAFNRFITITFKQQYELMCPTEQFSHTARWLSRLFSDCCSEFTLSPEYTENNRIHYHAQYRVKDWIKYRRGLLHRLHKVGFIKVYKSKSAQNVLKYITKDTEENKGVLGYNYLPITKGNWKNLKNYKTVKQLKAIEENNMLDKLLASDSD